MPMLGTFPQQREKNQLWSIALVLYTRELLDRGRRRGHCTVKCTTRCGVPLWRMSLARGPSSAERWRVAPMEAEEEKNEGVFL
jgi:hypothetical protein